MNFVVEQDDQSPLHRQVLEDHVHDGVQQIGELFGLQQRARDLDEDLEDLLARHRRGRLHARLGGRTDRGDRLFLQFAEVEAELGVEVGDAADDRARGVVEHRFAGELDRRHRLEIELNRANQDLVAGVDLRLGDEVAVDLHAVRRFQVDDPPVLVPRLDARVLARHRRVVQHQIVPLGPAQRHVRLQIGHTRDSEIDVVNLELFHRRS
jgi:hypothetical protein